MACQDRDTMMQDQSLLAAFNVLDKDGSGKISTKDIQKIWESPNNGKQMPDLLANKLVG